MFISHDSTLIHRGPNQVVLADICALIQFLQLAFHKKSPPFLPEEW